MTSNVHIEGAQELPSCMSGKGHLYKGIVSSYRNLAEGTTAKAHGTTANAHGTTANSVGAVGYFKAFFISIKPYLVPSNGELLIV